MGSRSAILAALAVLFAPDGAGNVLANQNPPAGDSSMKLAPTGWVQANTPQPLQSISASVAANALALGFIPTGSLQFRNPTLSNGTPVLVSAAAMGALSLTVPSGATLGTTSAVQSELVLLVAYDGGSPVLCVANIAGGLNFDETTLISPTTISSGATSASTIYSASAVAAGSPFRVVGSVTSTQAIAGTWATAPTLVQGTGGQAMAAFQSLGNGQTWQSVTGSRALGTTYYNTTNRPIVVNVTVVSAAAADSYAFAGITVGGVVVAQQSATSRGNAQYATVSAGVPIGASYSVTNVLPSSGVADGTVASWAEWR